MRPATAPTPGRKPDWPPVKTGGTGVDSVGDWVGWDSLDVGIPGRELVDEVAVVVDSSGGASVGSTSSVTVVVPVRVAVVVTSNHSVMVPPGPVQTSPIGQQPSTTQ